MEEITAKQVWEILIHIAPVVATVIIATVKIIRTLDDKISSGNRPIMAAVEEIKRDTKAAIEELWRKNNEQDRRFNGLLREHYFFRGKYYENPPPADPSEGDVEADPFGRDAAPTPTGHCPGAPHVERKRVK